MPTVAHHHHQPLSAAEMLPPALCLLLLSILNFLSANAAFSGPADAFLANDPCSVLLSGSRVGSVRSVTLDCEQGAVHWENPSGALLATFSVPADHFRADDRVQMCFRFPEPLPDGTVIQLKRMGLSRQLEPFPSGQSLQCVQSQLEPVQLFIRVGQQGADAANNQSISLFYAAERLQQRQESSVQCGICPQAQFLEHFCSANFVFIGKLLQRQPEANSLEFSAESPLLRCPLLLEHIARQGAQFSSTTLFADCPAQSQLRPSLHAKFVVVANAQLGYGRLLCLLEMAQFQRIPREGAPCDLRLRR